MRNTIKKIFVGMLAMAAIFIMSSVCYAGTRDYMQTIYLPPNQAWTTAGSGNRSGNFSFVIARTHAVYPVGGADHFTKCQCKITNTSGTTICKSSYYTLYETSGSYTHIPIKEGYLNTTTVKFKFRGNTSDDAYANVSYSAS
jgi:hypothetical protein